MVPFNQSLKQESQVTALVLQHQQCRQNALLATMQPLAQDCMEGIPIDLSLASPRGEPHFG